MSSPSPHFDLLRRTLAGYARHPNMAGVLIVGLGCERTQVADSRDAVDDVIGKAQGAGGGVDPGPKQDHGFMYGRSVEDPDGHHWEVMWMDVAAATAAQPATA